MGGARPQSWRAGLWALAAGLLAAGPAFGLVLHSGDPGVAPADTPGDSVMVRWSGNGSGVVIAPTGAGPTYASTYVLTTRHQFGDDPGLSVYINGVEYKTAEYYVHATADIRIVRIVRADNGLPANLASFVTPYLPTDPSEVGRTFVLGGYGYGRGADLVAPSGTTYGYSWDSSAGNSVLRWGQNKVDNTASNVHPMGTSYYSEGLVAHFDGVGFGGYVPHEAATADKDSGGGWFYNVGTVSNPDWRVAGLSAYVANFGQSLFLKSTAANPPNPATDLAPDQLSPIRVSSYAAWINGFLNPSVWVAGSGGNWNGASNWSPAVPNAKENWAVFPEQGAAQTVTLNVGITLGTVRFDSASNYTITSPGGSTLSFDTSSNAAIEVRNTAGNGSDTISAPLVLRAPLVVTQDSAGELTLSGVISSVLGKGLTKRGPGALVLAADNTFSGGLTVEAGTVRVTSLKGMGGGVTGGTVTLGGGTLDLRSAHPNESTSFNNHLTVTGDATVNVAPNGTGAGQTLSLRNFTIAGDRTLTVTGDAGYGLAFTGPTAITATATGATINTASADLALSGGLTLNVGTLTKAGPRTLTLSGTQAYGVNTVLNVGGGTLIMNADAGGVSGAASLAVNVADPGAGIRFGTTQHLAALNLTAGTAQVAAGGSGAVVTHALSVNPAASQLDVGVSPFVIDYSDPSGSPLDSVRQWVNAGRAPDVGGTPTWTGNGITSSAAALDGTLYAVGYFQNKTLEAGGYTSWGGVTVDPTSVLVRYSWSADVNLDGQVTDADATILGAMYDGGLTSGHTWEDGDLNGDGKISDADATILGALFPQGPLSTGPPALGLGDAPLGSAAGGAVVPLDGGSFIMVPEPATLLLVGAGLLGMALRRRRS